MHLSSASNPFSPQLDLFAQVGMAYMQAPDGGLDNKSLYRIVADAVGIEPEELDRKSPVGKSGQRHKLIQRKIRWFQQDLRRMKLIERDEAQRGVWRLTDTAEKKLTRALPTVAMYGFSTKLGVAIWGSCTRVFDEMASDIHLVLSSPPYPLSRSRAYGNPPLHEWVDFICRSLEPLIKKLAPGGSICLNVSNDIFIPGTAARSTYLERMVIAMEDRFGLFKMDTLIWENKSKAPGPIQWASKKRYQLNTGYEPVYWFCNDPSKVKSDNRRVLEEHSERHLKLIAQGGEKREASYADGAYVLKKGSFSNPTAGRIPKNVLSMGHSCADHRQYRKDAKAMGLIPHGAVFPLRFAKFLIQFLTEPGQLVVDPFGGTIKTGKAAEELGRRWVVSEIMLDYIKASIPRFENYQGFDANPLLSQWLQ